MRFFYVEAMGCQGNRADAARIHVFLEKNGWRESLLEAADLVVINSCAFTKFQEDQAVALLGRTRNAMKLGARLVVAGCLGSIAPNTLAEFDCEMVTPRNLEELDRIAGPIQTSIQTIPSAVLESGVYSLRVANGCLGACAYCAIPIANGRLYSTPIDTIALHLERQVAKGNRTFKLVGEDVGAYGLDLGLTLPDLLNELQRRHLGATVIIDSINPNWALRYFDSLVNHMKNRLVSEHIYIPFQSGSDRVLREMRRRYSVADVEHLYSSLLKAVPTVQISTDVMVGFPGETDEDFRLSLDLYRKFPFALVQVFAYEDREGIEAAKMAEKVPEVVKRQRQEAMVAEILTRLFRENKVSTREELLHFLGRTDVLPVNVNHHLT